jgi:hypothetical protein
VTCGFESGAPAACDAPSRVLDLWASMVMIVSCVRGAHCGAGRAASRANAGLRDVLTARDAESAQLRAENAELRAMMHALGLQVVELQRRLGSGSDDSGTPTSKESISAKARRKAERQARQEQQGQGQGQQPRGGSSRLRSMDKARGGQPGHPGHGLRREPNPNQQLPIDAPAECRGCGDDLTGAADAGIAWSQVWDVKIIPWRTEYLLPRRRCGCTVTTVARPPAGGVVNSISFGPVLNTAAVALTAFGNVPTERSADLIKILYGQDVSAGFVDRANTRLAAQLTSAGFEQAMLAVLMAEPVLAADESPVNVITPAVDPDTGEPIPGSPHVLAIRTPRRTSGLAGWADLPQLRHRHRRAPHLRRASDRRRLRRLPTAADRCRRGPGRHPAMRAARDPPLPRRRETRPRHPAITLDRPGHHCADRRPHRRAGRESRPADRPGPGPARRPA